MVVACLTQADLKFKIGRTWVHYLGFIVAHQKVGQANKTTDKKGLQHFLGLSNYYRCFIPTLLPELPCGQFC